jgi:hypothetical protein
MINQNIRLTSVDILTHRFSIEIADPELSKLNYKYGGVINVKISKPVSPKTMAQLAAFHPLSMALWLSGMHSAPDQFRQSYSLFRYWLKMELGPVTWVDYDSAKIPICKSIADYTKEEMSRLLEGTIVMCKESRAYPEDKRVREIIEGMDENTKLKYG